MINDYNWFLVEWMKAMPGLEHPKVIITDENASLLHVIPRLFSTRVHQYSI